MRFHAVSRRSRLAKATYLLLTSLSISCAAVPNPALERARDAYQRASQNPLIVQKADAALARAKQALEAAERQWTDERDVAEVEHLAYIVEKKVEIARVTAERRRAADQIEQALSAR